MLVIFFYCDQVFYDELKQCFSCLAARDQFTWMYTCLKCHSFYKCLHYYVQLGFCFSACKELVELKNIDLFYMEVVSVCSFLPVIHTYCNSSVIVTY